MVKTRIRILFINGARLYWIRDVGAISPFKYPVRFSGGKRYIQRNYLSSVFTGDQAPQFKLKPQL